MNAKLKSFILGLILVALTTLIIYKDCSKGSRLDNNAIVSQIQPAGSRPDSASAEPPTKRAYSTRTNSNAVTQYEAKVTESPSTRPDEYLPETSASPGNGTSFASPKSAARKAGIRTSPAEHLATNRVREQRSTRQNRQARSTSSQSERSMRARRGESMVGETNLRNYYYVARELSLMQRRKALHNSPRRNSETRPLRESYEESIRLLDQAVATNPPQPYVLIREAQALNARGIYYANSELSQQSLGGNNLEEARNNFRTAAKLSTRAIEFLGAKPAPTGDPDLARFNALKLEALRTRATSTRLLVQFGDLTQSAVAESAYQEYIVAETDPVKRLRSRRELATMFLNLNSLEQAKIQFEEILAENPNDPISLAGMGVTLFQLSKLKAGQGDAKASKANHEAALQYLDRYLKVAPRGILLDRATAMTLNEMNNRRREAMRPRSARP